MLSGRACCCCLATKSCPAFCNPLDCNPPGSSVHGILQARILEWVAISFSRGSSWPRDGSQVSYIGRQIFYHWATRFYCTAKWVSYMHAYIPLCLDSLPMQVTTERWVESPVLHTGFSLVICLTHSSAYVSVPGSQFTSLFPSVPICLFSMSVSQFLFCK